MTFQNIIAGGGGVKAISLIGCILALKEENILNNLKHYIGCSAGSVMLLFLLLEYDLKELYNLSYTCVNSVLEEENTILNILQENGIARGEKFINLIDKLIEDKIKLKNPSFLQLYEKTNKILTITVTNLVSSEVEYMNYKNYPTFKVSDAIRISCSLPLLFTSCNYFKLLLIRNKIKYFYYLSSIYKNYIGFKKISDRLEITRIKEELDDIYCMIYYSEKKWIVYSFSKNVNIKLNDTILINQSSIINKGSKISFNETNTIEFIEIITLADGAILDNFPIHLSNKLKGETIGFIYDYEKKNIEIDENIFIYFNRIKDCTLGKLLESRMKKYKHLYVLVNIPPHLNIYTVELTRDDKKELLTNGYKSTIEYLNNKKFPENFDTKSLILIDIKNINTLDKVINNTLKNKIKNNPFGIFSNLDLFDDKFKKYRLENRFYYIISNNGTIINKNREKIVDIFKIKNKLEDYNSFINEILFNLSKIERTILNTTFIVEKRTCVELYPFGFIENENSEKLLLIKNNELQILQNLKLLLEQKYKSILKFSVNIKKYRIKIILLSEERFEFINYLNKTHESMVIYTSSKERNIKLSNLNIEFKNLQELFE